jgi:hypothetical protein
MEEDGRLAVKISACGTHVTGKILFPPSPNLIGLFSLPGNHPKIVARLGKLLFIFDISILIRYILHIH